MAISQEQKVDFLLKKIGFTASKTGNATDATGLSGTLTPKAGFAEAIPSPLIIANTALWNESASIPATPPGSDTTQVKVYAPAGALRMTVDSTVANNRAFIAYTTYNNTSSARLTNWIDTQFGPDYIIQVFVDDATNSSNKLNAGGSGNNDGWFFDYSAGVLNFNDTNVPTSVTSTNVYIVGYRYVGQTGAPTSGISTFSYLDLTVERNLDVGIQGGISTFRNNIDLNADLDVDGHTNLDNVSIAGFTTITQDLDVDGHTNLDNVNVVGTTTITQSDQTILALRVSGNTQFQGAGNSGDVTFQGAGNNNLTWDKSSYELNFDDGVKARFGDNNVLQITGSNTTSRFRLEGNVPLTISKSTTENIAKFIPGGAVELYHNNVKRLETSSVGVSIPQDLDVDGHTNLDNISVAGVSTFTGDATFAGNVSIGGTLTYEDVTNVDSVGLLTARSGIRVTGGVIEAQAGENKIPSLYANLGALPSAGTYHGMFAHVHSTGRGYFAHAGNWLELVNKETNGTVGTGTETYNIGSLTATAIDLNGDIDVDGHTNLDNISVSGVGTFASSIHLADSIIHDGDTDTMISFTDNQIDLQTGGVSRLYANNFAIYVKSGFPLAFLASSGPSPNIKSGGTNNQDLLFTTGTGNPTRLQIGSNGTSTFSGDVSITQDLDVDGHTNLDNVSIAGFTTITQDLDVDGHTNLDNVSIAGFTTITQDLDVDGHTNLDNVSVAGVSTFAGNTFVEGVLKVTGNTVRIEGTSPLIVLDDTNHNHQYRVLNNNGTFEIKDHTNNANRFTILSNGTVRSHGNFLALSDFDVDGHTNLDNVSVAGVTTTSGLLDINAGGQANTFKVEDLTSGRVVLAGTGGELEDNNNLRFDGTDLYVSGIRVGAGGGGIIGLDITTRNLKATGISTFDGTTRFNGRIAVNDGTTGTNGQYLKSVGTGVTWASFPTLRTRQTFTASAGQTTFSFSYNVNFVDVFVNGIKLTDAEFTATNGSSVVLAVGCFVGDIVELVSYNTTSGGGGGGGGTLNNIVEDTTPQLGGNLDLFNKNITGTGNINITGSVTANNFIGNGSGLTGIVASGSGVVIKNSGSTVGTAGTINFGTNLSVSPASAGIVTITAGVTTSQFNVNNLDVAGITTISGITSIRDTVHFTYESNADINKKFFFWGNSTDRYAVWRRENISSPAFNLSDGTRLTYGSNQYVDTFANNQAFFWRQYTTANDNPFNMQSDFTRIFGSPTSSHNTRQIAAFEWAEGCSLYYTGTKRLQTSGIGITVTGSIVASGDLDVDGHTNLDNVSIAGVVTATTFKGALEATSGSFSSNIDANGNLDVDGHTNLDNVNIAGVTTMTGRLQIDSGDLKIFGTAPTLFLRDTNDNPDYRIMNSHGSYKIFDETNGVDRFIINPSGNVSILNDLDVDGHTNLDNVSVAGVTTFANDVKFDGSSASIYANWDQSGNALFFRDNSHVKFGNSNGMELTHSGGAAGNGNINNRQGGLVIRTIGSDAGDIFIDSKDDIQIRTHDTSNSILCTGGAGVKLYFAGSDKFETTTKGIQVGTGVTVETNGQATYTGIVTALKFVGDGSDLTNLPGGGSYGNNDVDNHLNVSGASSGQILSWNGSDYAWVADQTGGGGSGISTISGVVNIANDLDVDGHTNLDNISVAGVSTFAGITTVTGTTLFAKQLSVSGVSTFAQSVRITGAIQDFTVDSGTFRYDNGKLFMLRSGVDARYYSGTPGGVKGPHVFYTHAGGSTVEMLRLNGDTGATLVGVMTATSFSGDGSNLTGVNANVGITTNLSGTFTASAGSPSTINTFAYHDNDKVVEYTVYIKNGSNFQSQKVLAMRDGTTIHSTQFAVMFSSSLIVQCDATISSGNILLRATPESGVSGSTTYKVKREVM